MSSNAIQEGIVPTVDSLGFKDGQVVQEFYWDEDVDDPLRRHIEQVTGEALVDGEYGNVVDGVIIWWRADDAQEEDLADVLLDCISDLDNGGLVWVLTPKPTDAQHVSPNDVAEAARIAGLHATSAEVVAPQWTGMRLTAAAK
ncbi:DUF3052 domain-containing protein [Gleimia hominis]|uniref:DUF3052 domain-containing protein n=1 Tax=Gleimia hominis TaxID=595468 RepID=A0ABU3ICB5_9ACTO|nr:DUF3052 domain-containing protein [Gleimia hominis]MDT3767898.1 DUF3052 domain-containing protein [Gleimia hominis]WIK65291.1 DUF3052 domain-containing protein [Gleimia hominis]